ncbi:MAG: hypothetical protein GQ558_03830 [Thermoplasmata archaeon]|nr:hypothetical protein [Thermoplasmata archaeon]
MLPRRWYRLVPMVMAIAFVAVGMASWGENTPPQVAVGTPSEDAVIAQMVTVSGVANDEEGFNVSSYVEARWNDWEWFRLPINPGQDGHILYFGEIVNLNWHSPGPHNISVRAFDGELYSEIVVVNVTVRDLPDLVILPTDITLDPEDTFAGQSSRIVVLVRNQGGEDIEEVEVVVRIGDEEVGTLVIPLIGAYNEEIARFKHTFGKGNVTVHASALSLLQTTEKSMANNQADRTFTIQEAEDDEIPIEAIASYMTILLVPIAVYLFFRFKRGKSTSQKD